jgi:hypothetical protein
MVTKAPAINAQTRANEQVLFHPVIRFYAGALARANAKHQSLCKLVLVWLSSFLVSKFGVASVSYSKSAQNQITCQIPTTL